MEATFQGPRFGPHAQPDRDGMTAEAGDCRCTTCRAAGPFLAEPHHEVTFPDGVSIGHVPASHLRFAS